MNRFALKLSALSLLAVAVAACGGGGGGVNSVTPPPPPPPPPPPEGFAAVKIFPDVTASTDFATVGLELTGNSASPLTQDGFSVRYDAASDRYIFDLPTQGPAAFYVNQANTPNDSYWSGGLSAQENPTEVWPLMSVLKPTHPELQLTYTSFASYYQAGPMQDLPHGVVAFGLATPQGSVPVTGSATYSALVNGFSYDGGHYIGGAATLQFNFAQGTLQGHFDPETADWGGGWIPLGRYNFENTVFGVGSAQFSGDMRHATNNTSGSFDGLFTGPAAQELMANWRATALDPTTQTPIELFGVWVGKKP